MSPSFDLVDPDRFTAGTVGAPGQRIFYLQGAGTTTTVTLRCEKAQVAALAEYLQGLLADLPAPTDVPTGATMELVEPVEAQWTVGSIGVAYDADDDRVLIVAEEVVEAPADEGEEPETGASARFHLTRSQVAAFIARADDLLSAGRPLCPLCGRPMDPEGHVCPRTNGHGVH